jgi:hypothetical protein
MKCDVTHSHFKKTPEVVKEEEQNVCLHGNSFGNLKVSQHTEQIFSSSMTSSKKKIETYRHLMKDLIYKIQGNTKILRRSTRPVQLGLSFMSGAMLRS